MLLNTLIKISRNLVFENLIKTEKGKQTYKIGIINKRHRGAEELMKTGAYTAQMSSVYKDLQ